MNLDIGFESKFDQINEIVVNTSEKCNNLCLSCPNDKNFKNKEITKTEVLKFLDNNLTKDVQHIALIGGEPTIDPNLFSIISYIKKKNRKVVIQINSNGRMFYYKSFTNKFYEKIGHNVSLHIAIYGSNPKLHDSITQINGSYDQTIKGIKNLFDLRYSIQIRNIISKKNYKDLPKYSESLIKLFKNKLKNIKSVILVGMDILGNAEINKNELLVSHLDIAPYIEKSIDILKNNGLNVEVHLLPVGIFKKDYYKYVIKSGCVNSDTVNSYGCSECSMLDKCPRLLRSYVNNFGDKEHHPIRIL